MQQGGGRSTQRGQLQRFARHTPNTSVYSLATLKVQRLRPTDSLPVAGNDRKDFHGEEHSSLNSLH